MLGIIELGLIVVFLIAISLAILRSQGSGQHNQTRSPSRVNWSLVGIVFLGIPFLIIAGLGGAYLMLQVRTQHQVAVHQAERERALANELIARQQAEASQNNEIAGRYELSEEGEPLTSAENHSDSKSTKSPLDVYTEAAPTSIAVQEMPSELRRFSDSISEGVAIPVGFLLIVIAAIAGLVLVARKSLMLAATISACLLMIIGVGATLFISRTVVHQPAVKTSALPLVQANDIESAVGSIPVGETTESQDESPLRIEQLHYYLLSKGQTVIGKTIDKIPDWLVQAKDKQVFELNENEFVLTSQRFSSRAEAENQLQTLVNSLVAEKLTKLYPEMQVDWIRQQPLPKHEIIVQGCELTWPFQVGNFTDEMHQVAWKLKLSQPTQKRLYALWQQDELTQRLTLLGGAFGLVTLLLAVGAMLTREKKVSRTDL